MAVVSIGQYDGIAKDAEANFNGKRLIYLGWDGHLMFYASICLCLSGDTCFSELQENILPQCFGYHPDFKLIDWENAVWLRGNIPFKPDMEASLDKNGVTHKTLIRLNTPSLNGIDGSGF
jgi:phenol hydroxylase P4 protein